MTELVPIDSLRLDPDNVREHGEANLAAIAASLRRFGQQEPIVVDQANVVRDGNGTLTAAQMIGWTEIEIVRSELAGAEMTAYAVAANRTAELAGWKRLELAETLTALSSDGIALEDVGFTDRQLEHLKTDLADEILATAERTERKAAEADAEVDRPFKPPERFLIQFDSVEHYDHWFDFIAWLKAHENYLADTIAGRIDLFLAGQGFTE